jgi:peptidyl-prolyl cis-trans isomerase C
MTPKPLSVRIALPLLLLLGACRGNGSTATSSSPPSATPEPTATSTPVLPTPTPVPLAARVNGEPITLAEFQAELARYQATGTNLATDAEAFVLEDLINQTLLAQGAREAGFTFDDVAYQERLGKLVEEAGGAQALADWMKAQGYTEESFRLALTRSVAVAWMRDQIVNAVPQVAEQVHARQILLYNSNQANSVLYQINSGVDFTLMAYQYDPLAGGDLGWFPRGYLTEKTLEDIAFSLQPEQYSDVIQTQLGYHILYVVERDPQHPLLPDARAVLQEKALQDWLEQHRKQSEIQVLVL